MSSPFCEVLRAAEDAVAAVELHGCAGLVGDAAPIGGELVTGSLDGDGPRQLPTGNPRDRRRHHRPDDVPARRPVEGEPGYGLVRAELAMPLRAAPRCARTVD